MGYSDPEEEYEEFVSRIRLLCDKEADTSEFVDLIINALKGNIDAGEINNLAWSLAYSNLKEAVYEEARSEVYCEIKEQIDAEVEYEKAALKEQYEKKISEYEAGILHEVIAEKLLKEPDFLNYALKQLKEDLLQSKKQGVYPYLYEETLERIDQQELIDFFIKNFKDELIDKYREEIKNELFAEDYHNLIADLAREIKNDLRKDKKFVEQVRSEAIKDIAKKIFE